MISFITLSRQPDQVRNLQGSIRLALGTAAGWELIVIDGSQHDLFSGYNWGASQAAGDILAFVHDDVLILGNSLTFQKPLELLQDPATGFVGIAGSRVVGEDACWWNPHFSECRGMAAHPSDNPFGLYWYIWPWVNNQDLNTVAVQFGQVAVLDGLFLMCQHRVFEQLGGFDQQTYKGFHFYDLDITFRAALSGLKNYAAPIPIFHASEGFPGKEWDENRKLFVNKFRHVLPWRLTHSEE